MLIFCTQVKENICDILFVLKKLFCCSKATEELGFLLAKHHVQRNPYLERPISNLYIMPTAYTSVCKLFTIHWTLQTEPISYHYPPNSSQCAPQYLYCKHHILYTTPCTLSAALYTLSNNQCTPQTSRQPVANSLQRAYNRTSGTRGWLGQPLYIKG